MLGVGIWRVTSWWKSSVDFVPVPGGTAKNLPGSSAGTAGGGSRGVQPAEFGIHISLPLGKQGSLGLSLCASRTSPFCAMPDMVLARAQVERYCLEAEDSAQKDLESRDLGGDQTQLLPRKVWNHRFAAPCTAMGPTSSSE